jgi:hypothetical protein
MTILVALVFAGTDFFCGGGSGLYGCLHFKGRPCSRRRDRAGRTGATDCIIVHTALLRSEQFKLNRTVLGAVLVVPWHFSLSPCLSPLLTKLVT